jgi:hypothetical protein
MFPVVRLAHPWEGDDAGERAKTEEKTAIHIAKSIGFKLEKRI